MANKEKRTVSSSKTKAYKKAKDKKEDLRFMKIIHEKKFGDRPLMKKDSPHSTVAGYQSAEQRKLGTTQSKTTGVDKRLKLQTGGIASGMRRFNRGGKVK